MEFRARRLTRQSLIAARHQLGLLEEDNNRLYLQYNIQIMLIPILEMIFMLRPT